MLLKVVTVAVWAAVLGAGQAGAQSIEAIGGPRELPPSSFKGQMYVDSRGCVFLRAGYGGQPSWVPRVSRDRKVLCGYPPTLASLGKPVPVAEADEAVVAEASAATATAPMPSAAPAPTVVSAARKAVGKPMETIASLTVAPRIKAAPVQVQMPEVQYAAPVLAVPQQAASVEIAQTATVGTGRMIACAAVVPVPKRVRLSNGGTAVLCTRGDGTLDGARAPVYVTPARVGNRVGAGLYDASNTVVARSATSGSVPYVTEATRVVSAAPSDQFVVPKGYKLAWTDDRLNPNRAQGTAAGQAAQDLIWTRDVPAQLVAQQPVTVRRVAVSTKGNRRVAKVQVSTTSDPAARAVASPTRSATAAGKFYVQIGTFGVPAHAEGAKARLRSAGLPVGTAKITKAGKPLQIVLAGPFASAGQAQSVLSAARGVGFGDAFIR